MRIADAQWIPSTQHQTWDALTDPAVLQRCIPGCVNVTQRSPPSTPSPCVPRSPASTPTTTARSCCRTSIPQQLHPGVRRQGPGGCLAIGTAQVNLSTRTRAPAWPTRGGHDRRQAGRMRRELILKAGERSSSASSPRSSITWPASHGWRRRPAARARASRPVQLPLVLGAGAGGDRRVPELPHPLQVVDSLATGRLRPFGGDMLTK